MNNCPLEIHAYIFELACTDDGRTGRALSAVNRYIRHASAPYQWQSLVIYDLAQAKGFAALLNTLHDAGTSTDTVTIHTRRLISHLFVSNRTGASARDIRLSQWHAARTAEERQFTHRRFDLEAEEWTAAIRRILAYAADSVRTLTMMCYDIHISPSGRLFFSDLKGTNFPRLEDLTIRGGFDVKLRDHPNTDSEPDTLVVSQPYAETGASTSRPVETPTLPSLHRLHLICPISFELFLQRLRPLAPKISYIRLSELAAFDLDLCRLLFSELAERQIVPGRLPGLQGHQWSAEPIAQPVDWEPYLPPSEILERILLQPSQFPVRPESQCGCCTGYYKVDDMIRMLREMARESSGATFVYVPPGRRTGTGYAHDEAKRDWESRIDGGAGCWREKKDVDIDKPVERDTEEDHTQSHSSHRSWRPRRSILQYMMDSP
ncbi:hypothetical protein HETIRDRAFT_422408 [Heterobasidion irregulare TC 32-1]|uniref:Uncharacterized protein n=1 Tax=Heterobasidion irregulare (strain TC 32-1) TaxID=747525 RepID=W4JRN7_HETIT|nr:uncharacterized protein HETIRDRAFT_422408 [Heterobasidion irregulare TC 32-1]ETW75745.1 hypothetical protein HETIRDRAFT_422408 [Heterobasidion irregulare TC 32-1]